MSLRILLFVSALTLAEPLVAAEPSTRLSLSERSWDARSGLPEEEIVDFAQSPEGALWLATGERLYFFDGRHFDPVTPAGSSKIERDRAKTPTIQPTRLVTGADGALWVATVDGLYRFSDKGFRRFGRADGLPSTALTALVATTDGDLLIGTAKGSLHLFRRGRGVKVAPDLEAALGGRPVLDIVAAADGRVWLATEKQVALIIGTSALTLEVEPMGTLRALSRRAAGGVWAGGDFGVVAIEERAGALERVGLGDRREPVEALAEGPDQSLWLVGNGRLTRRQGADEQTWAPSVLPTGALPTNHPQRLFLDRQGNAWTSFRPGALLQVKKRSFAAFGVAEGLSSGLATSIFEAQPGELWITTRNAGLNHFVDGRFEVIDRRHGLQDEDLWSIWVDPRNDELWVGSSGQGLLHRRAGKWRQITARDGLAPGAVFAVLGRDDGIWAATSNGLSVVTAAGVKTYDRDDGLPSNEIRTLLEDRRGRLWIGSSGGVSLMRPDGTFENFSASAAIDNGNRAAHLVHALLEDREGVLWLGTQGGGLHRLLDGQIQALTTREGLLDDEVDYLLEDDRGFLWLGTARGLVRVAKAEVIARLEGRSGELHQLIFDRRDGLPGNVWQIGSGAYKSRDGRLHFVTRAGFLRVDPAAVEPSPAPQPRIVKVTADERSVLPGRNIRLAPDTLSFRFQVVELNAPERIKLRYRLEGHDLEWRLAEGEREAVYGRLKPGFYRFVVEASDGEQRFSGSTSEFAFEVARPIFVQLGFVVLSAVVLGAAVYTLHRLRVAQHARRERDLNAQIERALVDIRLLQKLLPICGICKRIRDDAGYWESLESYVSARSRLSFSTGLCPDCREKAPVEERER